MLNLIVNVIALTRHYWPYLPLYTLIAFFELRDEYSNSIQAMTSACSVHDQNNDVIH